MGTKMNQQNNLHEFEHIIGYRYQKQDLLFNALSHSSYANERHLPKSACNERLEFLGDAVLELVSSDALFHSHEEMPEGDLTRLRASIVCEPTLAFCARAIQLGRFLLLGKGEDMTGGRERDSVLSDALEAVIGSLYLDGGLEAARKFIMSFILNDLEHKRLFFDSKTILQEIVQKNFSDGIVYELVGEEGPDHCKMFTSRVLLQALGVIDYGLYNVVGGFVAMFTMISGSLTSKKAAEQAAAYKTILALRKLGYERN